MAISMPADLNGLRRLLSQAYVIQTHGRTARGRIEQLGRQRQMERRREQSVAGGTGMCTSTIMLPKRVTSAEELDKLIQRLQALKPQSGNFQAIEIIIRLED